MIITTRTRFKHTENILIWIKICTDRLCNGIQISGGFLDKTPSFGLHFQSICNKASTKIDAIRKVCKGVDHTIALKPYKSFVLVHYDHFDAVHMTTSNESLRKLQLLQNSVYRSSSFQQRISYDWYA